MYYFILMDVRKLLSLWMDAISCVQCCSVLADDTNLSQGCWYSGLQFLFLLCAPAPVHTMLPSCTLPRLPPPFCGTRDLSHVSNMTEGLFLCFTPDSGAGSRNRSKQTCMHLLTTARPAIGDSAEANKGSNESNSNLNTGACIANHLYSGLQWLITDYF